MMKRCCCSPPLMLLLVVLLGVVAHGFVATTTTPQRPSVLSYYSATTPTPSSSSSSSSLHAAASSSLLQDSVDTLKKVLEREYVSFFNPMRTEYYADDVTFDDPLTSLSGVQAYQTNVDMLSGRTLLGSILFEDGTINLHSVTGGEVIIGNGNDGDSIEDVVTRWTLRFTMKVFPWKPTARFSGVSIYKVKPSSNKEGVQIVGQTDYWDSINLLQGGNGNNYQAVDKSVAIGDFINQLKPGGFEAAPAAPEVPYSLLRRGKGGYEVRRYPAYSSVSTEYTRRDESFGSLGAFTQSLSPLGPAIMTVYDNKGSKKTMQWPLTFAPPGSGDDVAPEPTKALTKAKDEPWSNTINIVTIPSRVVAVQEFSDVSAEPVVRRVDKELRTALARDGLQTAATSNNDNDVVKFAQYDAIFSMGKRRSEVWIDLEDGGHPW